MVKSITYFIAVIVMLSLGSCATYPLTTSAPSATSSGPRIIIIDGEAFSEEEYGGFTSWYCKDFIDEGPVVVEVGYFGDPNLKEFGFILYDGGYSGVSTNYRRAGLEHRWDWIQGETGRYSFVIQTDGTGIYYDFSNVPEGESTKGSAVYKCYKR